MNEQFCNYKISKRLKELGFDEECLVHYSFYDNQPKFHWNDISSYNRSRSLMKNSDSLKEKDFNYESTPITAPLWQQAIDWLRKEHNYNITYNILEGYNGKKIINYIFKGGNIQTNFKILSKRSEFFEAREQAILKAIELISK